MFGKWRKTGWKYRLLEIRRLRIKRKRISWIETFNTRRMWK